MGWLIPIGIFVLLIVLRVVLPEPPAPKCDMCKDGGFIEVNIWYDEVITVECPKCNKQ